MSAKESMSTPIIVAPKKLIEVALPLEAINEESARAKRKAPAGYPTTLHCWFAQRPIAAARAVLFAQLVNDPSWKYSDDEIKRPQVRSAITRRRNELFKLIGELVPWSAVVDERVLERARAEIRASWRETCEANRAHPQAAELFDPSVLPAVADPFSGSGAIPLEAQRLGLRAHATDLNPVATLISMATIDLPARFSGRAPVGPVQARDRQTKTKHIDDYSHARGLAEDVRRFGEVVRDLAHQRLAHLYPTAHVTKEMTRERPDLKQYEGQDLPVIANLWARTVSSPNPAARGAAIPLVSTFLLSGSEKRHIWAEIVKTQGEFFFRVNAGRLNAAEIKALSIGTRAGKAQDFVCTFTDTPVSREYIRTEAKAGRLGTRLMAVVAAGNRERVYLPAEAVSSVQFTEEERLRVSEARRGFLAGATPTRAMITGGVCSAYGLESWGSLFTDRQLLALLTLSDLIGDVRLSVTEAAAAAGMPLGEQLKDGGDGARAYGEAVSIYLAFALDRLADYGSTIATWRPKDNAMRSTFSKQGLPMTWDFAEGYPFGSSSSGFTEATKVVSRALEFLPAGPPAYVGQADAQTRPKGSALQVFSTDPPYYDNISYGEISDFFYVWLRRTLKNFIPDVFATIAVPKAEELVAIPFRHGGKKEADAFFISGMTAALSRLASQAHTSVPITIYYAFKQSETEGDATGSTGWETFLDAVLCSGLTVTGTWPVRTEGDNRQIGNQANALASSIVLVCRVRGDEATTVSRKDFLRELERSLPVAIAEMTADPIAAIAPVDLAQACIGPGMAMFSRHKVVLEADGSAMSVHSALVHINRAIDDYFAHSEGELDAETRFCIGWFEQFGFSAGSFGIADVLARAKGTSVDGVREAGVVKAGKGDVRLLTVAEFPKDWDPTKDVRVPVWEASHHMCRALGISEGDAGALLAKMPEKAEAIRLLAYRLYTLCERKGWAEHARAYNELITSWPAIVDASHRVGHVRTQMDLV